MRSDTACGLTITRADRAQFFVVQSFGEHETQDVFRAIEPRTHGADRDSQTSRDFVVFEALHFAQTKRRAEDVGQLADRVFDHVGELALLRGAERVEEIRGRNIARGEPFVTTPTRLRTRVMQTAVHRRAHEPTAQVGRLFVFVPQTHQRILHGVPCEIVTAQNAARDTEQARNVEFGPFDFAVAGRMQTQDGSDENGGHNRRGNGVAA